MSATTGITLDTRYKKQNAKDYPVKLLVTYNRRPERYQTNYNLTPEEFNSLSASRVSDRLLSVRDHLKRIKTEADSFINSMSEFSFEEFEKGHIVNNPDFIQRKRFVKALISKSQTIGLEFDYTPYHKKFPILLENYDANTYAFSFQCFIKKLIVEGRIGHAVNHHCSYRSLMAFRGNLPFKLVTSQYLREYEAWMIAQENRKTTVGIYLRSLRTIFHEADAAGIIKIEDCYPFGRRKYVIPKGKGVKKAFTIEEIQKIFEYQPISANEQRAVDYWLFLYQGNGMNPKDFAQLKHRDLNGDFIRFERAKTEWSSRGETIITAYITENMRRTIKTWGNPMQSPNDYLFPVLKRNLPPLETYSKVQLLIEFLNRNMTNVFRSLGISEKGGTMKARHSFASVMKRSETPTAFIQERMGHKDVKTTENYLASFEEDYIKEQAAKLTKFNTRHH